MYVEFLGVPGAGKTTVAEEVCALLKGEKIDCVTRKSLFGPEEKRSHKSRWSLMHLSYLDLYTLMLWLRLAYRRKMNFEKVMTRIHEYQKLRYQLAHAGEQSILVWDNGFVQWFSNHVLAGIFDEAAAVSFIKKRLPPNTLFVFIDTPVTVAVERMQERETRFRATKGIAGENPSADEIQEQHRAFAESRRVQEALCNALAGPSVRAVRIDGAKRPKEIATIVCEHIKK